MSTTRFPTTTRAALWQANERRCFYCGDPVAFAALEIDHIIPEGGADCRQLIAELGLPQDFDMQSSHNLVPTHAHCNRRKSDHRFSKETLRYYLELAKARQPLVVKELDRLRLQAVNERLLITLAARLEKGLVAPSEVRRVLSSSSRPQLDSVSEPLVLGFSVNVTEFLANPDRPASAPVGYPQLCDWLELDLMRTLRTSSVAVVVQCEASDRNGETLSMRAATWAFDPDQLHLFLKPWWTLVEIAPFSGIYDQPYQPLFGQALVQTASDAVYSGDPTRPWRLCPRCGSTELRWDEWSNDHLIDDPYYNVQCAACRWSYEFK